MSNAGTFAFVSNCLWWACVAAQWLALTRIIQQRLLYVFPAFSIFLTASCGFSAVLITLGPRHPMYPILWGATGLINALLLMGAAVEVAAKLRQQYPNTGNLNLRVRLVVAVTVAVCGVMLAEDTAWWPKALDSKTAVICLAMAARRYLSVASAVGLLLIWRYYRIVSPVLSANLRNHTRLFITYAGATGVCYWLIYLRASSREFVNIALSVVPMFLYLGWTRLLSESGEWRPAPLTGDEKERAMREWKEFPRNIRLLALEIQQRARD